jgi:hypothetical protein
MCKKQTDKEILVSPTKINLTHLNNSQFTVNLSICGLLIHYAN